MFFHSNERILVRCELIIAASLSKVVFYFSFKGHSDTNFPSAVLFFDLVKREHELNQAKNSFYRGDELFINGLAVNFARCSLITNLSLLN